MTKENLEKSIVLIGPSCVGKSLISSELSKKTNMKHICIDDLLVMIEYEKDGDINSNIEKQKEFAKRLLQHVMQDPKQMKNLTIPKFEQKTFELIKGILDLYNSYVEVFGNLNQFHDIVEKHQFRIPLASYPTEKLVHLNVLAVDMLNKIFEVIDEPIIIDAPAPFGWIPSKQEFIEDLDFGDLQRSGEVDYDKTNQRMTNILDCASTVLLFPGEDYSKRNTVRQSVENNILLKNMEDYHDAKIFISTNAVFNQPENKFLQKRSWLDAEENIEREKLKNQCEINNICDQILNMINDLDVVKTFD